MIFPADGVPDRVVLDANIIVSRVLHELAGRLANEGLYEVVWSEELLAEAKAALIREKKLDQNVADRWVSLVRENFPARRIDISTVDGTLDLSRYTSDPDDEHICALAILGKADILLTDDAKFRGDLLQAEHGVRVLKPDPYLAVQLAEHPAASMAALTAMCGVHGWEAQELLARLNAAGCTEFARKAAVVLDGERDRAGSGLPGALPNAAAAPSP